MNTYTTCAGKRTSLPLLAAGCNRDSGTARIRPLEAGNVRVEDAFWRPRYEK